MGRKGIVGVSHCAYLSFLRSEGLICTLPIEGCEEARGRLESVHYSALEFVRQAWPVGLEDILAFDKAWYGALRWPAYLGDLGRTAFRFIGFHRLS